MTGEAQGSEDSIKSFLKEINNGPSAAHVVKVEKQEINTKVCTFKNDSLLPAVPRPESLYVFWDGESVGFHAQ